MELEGAFFNTSDYKQTDQKLGEGTFGTAYIVEKIEDKSLYAGKIINIQKIFSGTDQLQLMRESNILYHLNHSAIVKFYGINFHSFTDPTSLQPTILTEYFPLGSLNGILEKTQQGQTVSNWNGTKKCTFLLGISSAMKYLHQKGILHGNLKPENVLIDQNNNPKVSNFGFSQCFPKTRKNEIDFFTAPELLENNGHFDKRSDVYSFGILAYEIITGKEPYSKSMTAEELKEKVKSGVRPELDDSFADSMKDLLGKCWSSNVDERPSFDEIYDKLSSDFSYFNEEVDVNEIKDYLAYLEKGCINDKKEENVNDLKRTIIRNQDQIDYLVNMIKDIIDRDDFIEDMTFRSFEGNALHYACRAGNLYLVKYLISLDKFDVRENTKVSN